MQQQNLALRSRALSLLAVLIASTLTLSAAAQKASSHTTSAATAIPNRLTQGIDESQLITLGRNTRPEANRANDRGALPEGYGVEHMLLLLQRSPEQEQALDKLIDSLNDRKSPNFHHWLTAEEFGQRFGVSQDDIDAVTKWLESQGFRVNQVYPNHIVIDFSGTAGAIRQGFHTEIHSLEVNGEEHLSNMSDPQIPAALAPVVKGIFSLNDFKPEPMYKSAKDYTFAGCTSLPTQSGTNCYSITPQDNATIYNLNPLFSAGISGQSQTIALVEDTDTYSGAGDWNTYRSTFGLSTAFPAGTYTQVHPGGCTDPGTNGDDGEAAIDVEVASAVAPSAAIELISCPSSTFTFGGLIALQNMINGSAPYPGVVSVSYGLCEALTGTGGSAGFYNTFQQAASQGISVFSSSGDGGPSGCGGDFGEEYDLASLGITGWGETPYNVSVGGTDFEDVYNAKTGQNGGAPLSTYWNSTNTSGFGSAKSYIPEMPWDDACANALISFVTTGSFTPYGASPATCNNTSYNTTATYLSTGAGAGGASNCATGAGGTNQSSALDSVPGCQGYPKPSWQSGSSLTGGQAVFGQPFDGVRDIPDVSMFAANGAWGHFETVCWSDPSQTSGGATSCSGAPSTWSGFGGTSVAAPTMAAIQALVNQKTGTTWGNPNPIYYQIAQSQYGVAGGTFLGSGCNSSTGNTAGCAFNDVTQGDIDLACEYNGTVSEAHCFPGGLNPTFNSLVYGVDSTDNVTAVNVINGGSGYTTAPTCAIAGPSNNNPYKSPTGITLWAGGTQATCTAAVNSGSTNAVWTVVISGTPAASWANTGITIGGTTYTFVTTLGSVPNSVLLVTSGTSTAKRTNTAKNLEAAVNNNSAQCATAPCFANLTGANSSATATESTNTVTLTAKTAAYAGNFNVAWSVGYFEGTQLFTITNTTPGQGPNYVSGITITAAGSGYQPETPITLGGPGAGAVAVANTSPGTPAQSYQPTYGAAPGYDLATGLGTPNAKALVCSTAWGSGCVTASFTLTANPTSGSVVQGSSTTSTISVVPAGGFNGSVTLSATNLPSGVTASFSPNPTTSTSTMTLTANGGATVGGPTTVAVNGVSSSLNASTNYGLTVTAGTPGIYSPANGSTFSGNSATFSWIGYPGATAYWLDVGKEPGGNEYEQTGSLSSSTFSQTVNSLPSDGSAVYATWYYFLSGSWQSIAYTYTAFGGGSIKGIVTSPTPGSTLAGTSVPFSWSAGTGSSAYWIDAGNVAGGNQYYQSGNLGNVLGTTVTGLPSNGSTVYVTLYSFVSGQWLGNAYTYTAYSLAAAGGVLTTPTPGSVLTSATVTFGWTAGAGATSYWLDAGSTAGGNQYFQSGSLGNVTSVTASGLPTDGSTIYVTLYSLIGGQWSGSAYTYTALNATGGLAVIQNPSNGATLSGTSQTFTWNADSSATAYWLDIGNVAGGNQYYQSGNLGNVTSTTVNSLPADGSTIYATLYSFVGGQWLSTSSSYTSGP